MIAKGTTHNDGAKLAVYMTTGKENERAELWELDGFASDDIKEAFRSVHVMAEATKCQQPFFHVQVRNREGETLTRDQWEIAAQRIMRINRLTGQPYAIAFHIDKLTGEEHMHLAVSLIDADTLTAKRLPFFKYRLKTVTRELEKEFGLEPVRNEREGPIKYGPTRAEEEQARRLGFDKEAVRNSIRNCFDRSDNGRSFQAALEDEGLILAQGDRRGYLVIDHAGGLHVLGKRTLDASAAQVRAKLADIDREHLPTVDEAREFVHEVSQEREHSQKPDKLDRLKDELAEIQQQLNGPSPEDLKRQLAEADRLLYGGVAQDNLKRQLEETDRFLAEALHERSTKYPNRYRTHWQEQIPPSVAAELEKIAAAAAEREYAQRDPSRDETAWQDALAKAAIEREKVERQFVEPQQERETRGGRKKDGERQPDAAPAMPDNLRGSALQIWTACARSDSAKAFAAALDEHGIALAVPTPEEAQRSHMDARFAKEVGRFSPEYRAGEVVAVTLHGDVYKLDRRTTGKSRDQLDAFLAPLDRTHLRGITSTKESQQERLITIRADQRIAAAQERAAHWDAIRLKNATSIEHRGRDRAGATPAAPNLGKATRRTIGSVIGALGKLADGFSLDGLTPKEKYEAAKRDHANEREADKTADHAEHAASIAEAQKQEQQREAERKQERERYGGGRER